MEKPTLPKGTRDFGPAQMAKRQLILETIKGVFRTYCFQPLETPAMEDLTTLTGKYGAEGDQLIFKILNSGDFLKEVNDQHWAARNPAAWTPLISEKGLRYDLTVPFARYVVMNRHEITFPFKRFQVQPVWRADRPQKGRYREFYQCDADVVGTDSLVCEAEIILMIREVFAALGIQDYAIKINHRAILSGLAEIAGAKQNEGSLFVAIDKLDKIGEAKVKEELQSKGFETEGINRLFEILRFEGTTKQKVDYLINQLPSSKPIDHGVTDLREVLRMLRDFGTDEQHLEFDMSLARGLSYYTGTIFEVKINQVSIGSVSGGGRYDNLTGVFGMPGLSGVGFSFGVDRLYDAMEELKLFPADTQIFSTVLVAHLDEERMHYGLKVVQTLRQNNIRAEIYPEPAKLKKQLEYADKKSIPYVVVLGSEEVMSGHLTLKNMKTGEQQRLSLEQILKYEF